MNDDTLTRGACAGCHASSDAVTSHESGIGRRTFLAQAAVMAAVAALAACGGGSSATAPTLSTSTTLRVADYPALANVGGVALVTISSSPFAIVRTSSTTFVTLSRICPHEQSIVNQSGTGFLCPNHGAQFTQNGTWVGGQPTSSLRSYPTAYDATAGTLTIG